MNVESYELTLIVSSTECEQKIELIYRGNENILIKSYVDDQYDINVKVPRHALEKFLEMINGN